MGSSRYTFQVAFRLALIFLAMLALTVMIGQEARLFSMAAVSIVLLLLVMELLHKIFRTNRILESLLDSIRSGEVNRTIREKAGGLGFRELADSAQQIVRAIASARIEKETQYRYLQAILEHIHTSVITFDEQHQPELINPIALRTLDIFNSRKPTWQEIEKRAPLFAASVSRMGDSGRETVKLETSQEGRQLLVLANTVRIGDRKVKIVTFQDIEPEIEQKEMESWQTISRIMAHEIMNSLTPLSSLTETGIMMLQGEGGTREVSTLSQSTVDNLHQALRTIADRNLALTRFIGNYRELSRLPLPDRTPVRMDSLLKEIRELYEKTFSDRGIGFSLRPGPAGRFTVSGDETQLKQVLINLIKNALEALEGRPDPTLEIAAKRVFDHLVIELKDNGPGIPADLLDKIFIPFFSTKPEGSGIGLSLSRQIIRNHRGHLSVTSGKGGGSRFRISLPLEPSN